LEIRLLEVDIREEEEMLGDMLKQSFKIIEGRLQDCGE
jgi:hypothetical protein